MKQHGFNLIIGIVGDGDPRRALLISNRGEEFIAGDASRCLDADLLLLSEGSDIGVARRNWQPHACAVSATKRASSAPACPRSP